MCKTLSLKNFFWFGGIKTVGESKFEWIGWEGKRGRSVDRLQPWTKFLFKRHETFHKAWKSLVNLFFAHGRVLASCSEYDIVLRPPFLPIENKIYTIHAVNYFQSSPQNKDVPHVNTCSHVVTGLRVYSSDPLHRKPGSEPVCRPENVSVYFWVSFCIFQCIKFCWDEDSFWEI